MGGGSSRIYSRPVRNYGDRWRSTFTAHTRRNPPSREPGVDYYCPLGTELVSLGDGVVSEIGGGVVPATGRYVKVNMFNGQSFRLLHLGPRHSLIPVGHRVQQDQPLAISGASGYGSEYFGASSPNDPAMIRNTGGPHTHLTLFPKHAYNNFVGLLDPEEWMKSEGLFMALSDAEQMEVLNAVRNIYSGLYVGGPSTADGGPLMATIGRIAADVGPINRGGEFVSLRQEVADAKTNTIALLGREPGEVVVDIDEAAIVAGLLAALPTADVELFAKAAADEMDRRAKLRDDAADAVDVNPA